MAIFTASPNSYSDVFKVFYNCFNKYWSDCPYERVLATNSQEYAGITVINNNNPEDNWMMRTIPALKKINSRYVLHIADDCFVTEKINNQDFESILDDMDKYGINFCGLANKIGGKPVRVGSLIGYVKKRKPYAKNLQAGIFNREYLLQLLGDGAVSSWELEKQWVTETLTAPNEYFEDVTVALKNVLPTMHGVAKGKWFPTVLKRLEKIGIKVESERKVLSKKEELKINIIKKVGKMFSPKMRRSIKNLFAKLGYSFSTEN